MDYKVNADANFGASVIARPQAVIGVTLENWWRFRAYDPHGYLKWEEYIPNLVTTVGKNDLLTQYFKGSAYTATWYVGLVDNASFTAYSAADTMASHSGWLESTAYSNSTRPTLTLGTASAGSIDNTGSVANFSINATVTIRGGFIANNSTKGGTTGTVYGEADFTSGSRSLGNGDALLVTVTLTAS